MMRTVDIGCPTDATSRLTCCQTCESKNTAVESLGCSEIDHLFWIDVGDQRVHEVAFLPSDDVVASAFSDEHRLRTCTLLAEVRRAREALGLRIGKERQLRSAPIVHDVSGFAIVEVGEARADELHARIAIEARHAD